MESPPYGGTDKQPGSFSYYHNKQAVGKGDRWGDKPEEVHEMAKFRRRDGTVVVNAGHPDWLWAKAQVAGAQGGHGA